MEIKRDHIEKAAYFLWLREGKPEGRAFDHWIAAIRQLTPHVPLTWHYLPPRRVAFERR